jgi:hypothetical protein
MAGADNAFQTAAAGEPAGVCANPQDTNRNIAAKNKITVRARTVIRMAPGHAARKYPVLAHAASGKRYTRSRNEIAPSNAVFGEGFCPRASNRPTEAPRDGAPGDRPHRIFSEIRKLTTLEVV